MGTGFGGGMAKLLLIGLLGVVCVLASAARAQDVDAVIPEYTYTELEGARKADDHAADAIAGLNALTQPSKRAQPQAKLVAPKSPEPVKQLVDADKKETNKMKTIIGKEALKSYVSSLSSAAPLIKAEQMHQEQETASNRDVQAIEAANAMFHLSPPKPKKVAVVKKKKHTDAIKVSNNMPVLSSAEVRTYLKDHAKEDAVNQVLQKRQLIEADKKEKEAVEEADNDKKDAPLQATQDAIMDHLDSSAKLYSSRVSQAVELAAPMSKLAAGDQAADWLSSVLHHAETRYSTTALSLENEGTQNYGQEFGKLVSTSAEKMKGTVQKLYAKGIQKVYSQQTSNRVPVIAKTAAEQLVNNENMLMAMLGLSKQKASVMLAKYHGNLEHTLQSIDLNAF